MYTESLLPLSLQEPPGRRPEVPVNPVLSMAKRSILAFQNEELSEVQMAGYWNMFVDAVRTDFPNVVLGSGCSTITGDPHYAAWFGYVVQSVPEGKRADLTGLVLGELTGSQGQDAAEVIPDFTQSLAAHINALDDPEESNTTYAFAYDAFDRLRQATIATDAGYAQLVEQGMVTLMDAVNSGV